MENAPNMESALTIAQMRNPTLDFTGRATATVQHRQEQRMTSRAAIGTTCVKQLHFVFTLLVTFLIVQRSFSQCDGKFPVNVQKRLGGEAPDFDWGAVF